MSAFKDLTGQTINGIKVLRLHSRGGGRAIWVFLCQCGAEFSAPSNRVKSGNTKSCGCLAEASRRSTENKYVKHGHNRPGRVSREYNSYTSMKTRCLNKNSPNYCNYGGRGIRICQRWLDGFENFLEDMGNRPPGKTLDRINVDGDYEPSNCRWATLSEQQRNKQVHRKSQP